MKEKKRFLCKIGFHKYLPGDITLTYLGRKGDTLFYKEDRYCVYCGKHKSGIVDIDRRR